MFPKPIQDLRDAPVKKLSAMTKEELLKYIEEKETIFEEEKKQAVASFAKAQEVIRRYERTIINLSVKFAEK